MQNDRRVMQHDYKETHKVHPKSLKVIMHHFVADVPLFVIVWVPL